MREPVWALVCVVALIVVAFLVPPEWDPAMMLKQWTEKRRRR